MYRTIVILYRFDNGMNGNACGTLHSISFRDPLTRGGGIFKSLVHDPMTSNE